MNKVLWFLAWSLPCWLLAQQTPRFTVEVSTDSVLWGNSFTVTFTLENVSGAKFEAPDFQDFQVVAGPSMSSSFRFVNGTSSQSVSYSYQLEPKSMGVFYIPPAFAEHNGATLETAPVAIKVAPNPDNIKQQPKDSGTRFRFQWDDFGFPPSLFDEPMPKTAPEPEKKRKTIRL